MGWTLLAFASLALATLTKGLAAPVLVGMTLICSLPWAWRTPALRGALLRTLLDPLGWLLFAALAAPWFVLVDRAHPGHASFFFVHEHFARFTSHVHSRQGSDNPILDKLYFVGVLAAGARSLAGRRHHRAAARGCAFLRRPGGPVTAQAPLHRWTVAASLLALAWPLAFYSRLGLQAAALHPAGHGADPGPGLRLRAGRGGAQGPGPFRPGAAGAGHPHRGGRALRVEGRFRAGLAAGHGRRLGRPGLLGPAAPGTHREPLDGRSGRGHAAGHLRRGQGGRPRQGRHGPGPPGARRTPSGSAAATTSRPSPSPAGSGRWWWRAPANWATAATTSTPPSATAGSRRTWTASPAWPCACGRRTPGRPVWALVDRHDWRDLPEAQRQAWALQGGSRSCMLVALR